MKADKYAKRRRFHVGVPKVYFPKGSWPECRFTSYMEVFTTIATSRVEAAVKIWGKHGQRLLAAMTPGTKRISLDVDEPACRTNMGRLRGITVYDQGQEVARV